jgi:ABC-2 type transport system ATP-binding protein
MSIRISGLTKSYGSHKAIDNITFSVEKGEIVGFLGPNGAGKSTTMKIITGYLKAESGNVLVSDKDVSLDPIAVKNRIGYLPESNPLYYDMYVREYLHFLADVHRIQNKKNKTEQSIEKVGLMKEANKKIGQLSKGYKQRVGLAAALIHDPEVLILDEPTTGLDPNQIIEIREVIRSLGKEKTVLFSSHILQEVEAICKRVVIIHKGSLVADDQLNNLLKGESQNEILLEVKEEVDPGVFDPVAHPVQVNANIWKFVTHEPDILKRKLMELSLQHPFEILSLQSNKAGNLETLFRQLTHENSSPEDQNL